MTKYICALDIGSVKVCAILGDWREKRIISVASSPARGVSQGVVVNVNDLSDVIADVKAKLEQKTEARIKDVYVNISGCHIEGKNVKGKVIISEQGSGVSADDIARVVNFAENFSLPLERRIVHQIIQDYTVDGQEGIANPINLYGHNLEVNLQIITASRQEIEKLAYSVNCAGLNIKELVPSAILPQNLSHNQHADIPELRSSAYATSLGLIQYGFQRENQQKKTLRTLRNAFNKIAHHTKKTFSTYF